MTLLKVNACLDHADALMLSGETANGKSPERAVRMMTKIAGEVEDNNPGNIDVPYSNGNKLATYLATAAVKTAVRIKTRAIVADSLIGKSILALAAYRGPNVIYESVDLLENQSLKLSICRLVAEDCFKDSDLVVIPAGSSRPKQGASYIEISSAENSRQNCGHL